MRIDLAEGCLVRSAGLAEGPALWFVHGFSDSGLAFRSLLETDLAGRVGLFAPDLPGFGASPPQATASTVDGMTDVLLALIERMTPGRPVGLVGHSVGAVNVVEAAHRLGDRCLGVFSIEGNLTADDAYFSGKAADFDDAAAFKAMFTDRIWERAADNPVLRHYYASLVMADAATMWAFGCDVKRFSVGDQPGHRYRALSVPTLYYWCADNTPEATVRFLGDHAVENRRFHDASHWPMLDDTAAVAAAIAEFFAA